MTLKTRSSAIALTADRTACDHLKQLLRDIYFNAIHCDLWSQRLELWIKMLIPALL